MMHGEERTFSPPLMVVAMKYLFTCEVVEPVVIEPMLRGASSHSAGSSTRLILRHVPTEYAEKCDRRHSGCPQSYYIRTYILNVLEIG